MPPYVPPNIPSWSHIKHPQYCLHHLTVVLWHTYTINHQNDDVALLLDAQKIKIKWRKMKSEKKMFSPPRLELTTFGFAFLLFHVCDVHWSDTLPSDLGRITVKSMVAWKWLPFNKNMTHVIDIINIFWMTLTPQSLQLSCVANICPIYFILGSFFLFLRHLFRCI